VGGSAMSFLRSDPKNEASSSSLVDLDDPSVDDDAWEERPPDTARPEYDSAKFAQDVELAKERMTTPPTATYEMLRDSCKELIAEEVPLDEERILRPGSRRQKVGPERA
jgi:hypothetical protein